MIEEQSFRRRRLPHWDMPGATYFLTTCLEGSIPAPGLLDLDEFRRTLEQQPKPADEEESDWKRKQQKKVFARVDWWLDFHSAARHLADPCLAKIVVNAFYHFAGQRYDLLAFVVMPSHIHWVFQPLESWVGGLPDDIKLRSPRQRIQHSVNRFTASGCNKMRGAFGDFWQRESYDHWVRDVEELERIIHYIEQNPVRSHLVDAPDSWPFSSAFERKKTGLDFGEPLIRNVRAR